MTASFEDLGLPRDGKALVRDLWKKADLGPSAGRFQAKVDAHGVVMVKITHRALMTGGPHRRKNPLLDEWVVCSPQRLKRPWQGQVEAVADDARPAYDPGCYLCPGNSRAEGQRNPDYRSTFVFDNDFPALHPAPPAGRQEDGLLVSEPASGVCRVLCFSPRHDLTLAEMDPRAIRLVVDAWADEVLGPGAPRRRGLRPGLREQGRHDGMQQSAPPRPDLGERPRPLDSRAQGPDPGGAFREDGPRPARGLSRAGAAGRGSRRRREPPLGHARALLGGLAVRDHDRSAAPRGRPALA